MTDAERVLVVPTMRPLPGSDGTGGAPVRTGEAELMLRTVVDRSGTEHLVALAFSTVAVLVERMGEEQPWVAIPADALEAALNGSGVEAVLLDPAVVAGD